MATHTFAEGSAAARFWKTLT